MITCVILTIVLREKPHADDFFNSAVLVSTRFALPKHYGAICYKDFLEIL